MADGKLIFLRPASGSGKLVLGDAHAGSVTPDAAIRIDAGFAGDGAASVRLVAGVPLAVDAGFAGDAAGAVGLQWDANVSRVTHAGLRSAWQEAAPVATGLRSAWQESDSICVGHIARWQPARPLHTMLRTHWQATTHYRGALLSRWQQGTGARRALQSGWQTTTPRRAAVIARWQQAAPARHVMRPRWEEATRLRNVLRSHWQDATPIRGRFQTSFTTGTPIHVRLRSHWQEARKPPPGRWAPPPGPPIRPPCYDPARLGLLVFDTAFSGSGKLVFVCHRAGPDPEPGGTIVVPARRTYIVINSIELRRADDLSGPPLPSEAFGMTLDADSWTWSWSATFGRAARDAVAPGPDGAPVEIEARVNGQPFRLQAERIGRSVRFPERLVKVSGRGKAALLDAPHAAVQSFGNTAARSAHQLMQDVLTINGVGIGWTVDWGLTDWPVPAGVWTHQGTWASALNDIAGAAGGYVQPHDTAATLRVLPRWPKPWWEWASATPDIELPAGIAEVEETEWIDKPAYDRVIVHGALGGVRGNFKRAGTAGEVLRPMVVHPLITHADVVRQRAIAELSDSGRLINQTLTLMVLPETGVIKPGTLLRYTDDDGAPRLGLVRSTGINWSFPVLTQTIGVEGHA